MKASRHKGIKLRYLLFGLLIASALLVALNLQLSPTALIVPQQAPDQPPRSTAGTSIVEQVEYTTKTFQPSPNSFSACVMFKDDTHRLIEWMAYHYQTLPLHRIIIGVDGGSNAYPIELVDRYADKIKTTLWPVDKFAPPHAMNETRRQRVQDGAAKYLRRQTLFLRACALTLHEEGRGWTLFTDPDEYLVFNYPAGETPGQHKTTIKEWEQIVMPGVSEQGGVYKFLSRLQQDTTQPYSNPCITVPRLLFGSLVKSKSKGGFWESMKSQVSGTIADAATLDTLRYRSHSRRTDFKKNRNGKTILDLQRFTTLQLSTLKNVHTMVPGVCWHPQTTTDDKSLFKLNHYLGSRNSFFHRQDDRDEYGRKDNYDKFADIDASTDDIITGWYPGFVETQGQIEAARLLQGAGEAR